MNADRKYKRFQPLASCFQLLIPQRKHVSDGNGQQEACPWPKSSQFGILHYPMPPLVDFWGNVSVSHLFALSIRILQPSLQKL